jgi:beta-galactosidase
MITPKVGIPKQTKLFYGADYNPDQWQHSSEFLERDIELMKQAGVTSASVGIFGWTALEPEEGHYTFEWLDRVVDRFSEEGMFVFLATPSGSKPMWLSEKYPEVRRVNQDGICDRSGGRHNRCMSSSVYRAKTAQKNRALAERFKYHPEALTTT